MAACYSGGQKRVLEKRHYGINGGWEGVEVWPHHGTAFAHPISGMRSITRWRGALPPDGQCGSHRLVSTGRHFVFAPGWAVDRSERVWKIGPLAAAPAGGSIGSLLTDHCVRLTGLPFPARAKRGCQIATKSDKSCHDIGLRTPDLRFTACDSRPSPFDCQVPALPIAKSKSGKEMVKKRSSVFCGIKHL